MNQMWRNGCINDTYEPGSTFKIITASACLEEGVVHLDDTFSCPGYRVVEDRKIRCHKVGGHGSETFVQGIQNSCNPVFIDIGLRLGVDRFYDYFGQFGLMDMTGVDLPGEAGTIMHNPQKYGRGGACHGILLASRFRSHRSSLQQPSVGSSMAETGSHLILGSAWKVRTEQRCGHWNIRWKAGSCPVRLPGQYVRSWKL